MKNAVADLQREHVRVKIVRCFPFSEIHFLVYFLAQPENDLFSSSIRAGPQASFCALRSLRF